MATDAEQVLVVKLTVKNGQCRIKPADPAELVKWASDCLNCNTNNLQVQVELIDSIGPCIEHFADDEGHPAIVRARELHVDGEVEVDNSTIVSEGGDPNGDYVLAWLWADYPKEEPYSEDRDADG